jgi:SAM-dependent MidA family methyltransferase
MINNLTSLENYVKYLIKQKGPITVAEFMVAISYHKSLGYYENHKIGEDFITSPQISKSFGGLIGAWIYNLWLKYFTNQEISIIELGAGNGEFINSIMNIILQIPEFAKKITFYIVENSNLLTKIQQNRLKSVANELININWVSDVGLINTNKPVFFISNEFFDCLPINQFFFSNNGLFEILINYNENIDEFFLCLSKNLSHSHHFIKKNYLNINNIIEISTPTINISKYINYLLEKNKGISLIIDYGYNIFHGKSTLQTIYKHKKNNDINNDIIHNENDYFKSNKFGKNINKIINDIKNYDISAHVNFEIIIDNLINCENKFYTQHEFLKLLNIDQIKQFNQNIEKRYSIEEETSIGNLFKVLFSKNTN